MTMITPSIDFFIGPHRFLSNFEGPSVTYEGVEYKGVEWGYQAAKTHDLSARSRVRECTTPAQARRMGQSIPLRPDWNDVKLLVMEELLRQKFNHPEFQPRLMATGDAHLREGNWWWDTFWGQIQTPQGWRGLNHLGRLLMKIRYELGCKAPDDS